MTQIPLDAPEKAVPPRNDTLRILQIVCYCFEGLLWMPALLGLLFKIESWEYGSEIIILAFTSLGMFYFLAPILLLGSRGWRQHVGAHVVGFSLLLMLYAAIFRLESWAYGREMSVIAFFLAMPLLLTTMTLWAMRRRQSEGRGSFYGQAALRLGILLLLTRALVQIS